jgi:hypothetical protein
MKKFQSWNTKDFLFFFFPKEFSDSQYFFVEFHIKINTGFFPIFSKNSFFNIDPHFKTRVEFWKRGIFSPKIFLAYTRDCPGYTGILGGSRGGYPPVPQGRGAYTRED